MDGNRWSEDQSINRYQTINLINWYGLVSINRWSIDNHKKNRSSFGTATPNRLHACYLSDHPPFLGNPGDDSDPVFSTQRTFIAFPCHPGYPIDGTRWSKNQSITTRIFAIDWSSIVNINRYIDIKWYWLISIVMDYHFIDWIPWIPGE